MHRLLPYIYLSTPACNLKISSNTQMMASNLASSTLFLTYSLLLLFNLANPCDNCCVNPPNHECHHHHHHRPPPPYSPYNPPPHPTPSPPSPGAEGKCPRDALKLGICANVLGGLLNITLGTPPKEPCCTLLKGLADLEAAVCLCTALRGYILGINLNLPISLSLLLNYCGKKVPTGFLCY